MPKITLIQNGNIKNAQAGAGALLSTVILDSGAHLDMPCAGKGTCKKCTVKIADEPCLACQTKIDGDMTVELLGEGDFAQILTGAAAISAENPLYTRWGLSVDIGTTTICASLIGADYSATVTRKNPQSAFGADVISRIEQALGGNLAALAHSVRAALTQMTGELASQAGIAVHEIDAAVITGNTTMLYLLAGQDPAALSHAPFAADRLFGEFIDNLPGITAKIYLPHCISAFVGADITTAILASGMCSQNETALLVDIGTNGELALWHNGALHCTSTAAGPAFEGGGISCGVYGIAGAIDKAWIENGQLRTATIGGGSAIGICGSGIVDTLACMLQLQIVDETGAFCEDDPLILQDGIEITAQDIRKIQLAKGSVRAGIETLLTASGVAKADIHTLYLAGGFGNYLDLQNAAAIGLIPPELLPVTRCIGNAAHAGATMLLQNQSLLPESARLSQNAVTVALDANPVFTENYMQYMLFDTES